VLRRVVGRTLDYLMLPSGEKRRPILNHYRLAEVGAIREFQIVQRSLERIEVLMVLGRPPSADETATLVAVLAAELGGGFDIVLTPCETIPRTAAGKLRPFMSDLPRV
jgi:phenylacetate-CoA ligase